MTAIIGSQCRILNCGCAEHVEPCSLAGEIVVGNSGRILYGMEKARHDENDGKHRD